MPGSLHILSLCRGSGPLAAGEQIPTVRSTPISVAPVIALLSLFPCPLLYPSLGSGMSPAFVGSNPQASK
jgi:hypothetical protein